MILYSPNSYDRPKNILDVPSAWKGLESILKDIIERFNIKTEKALEFGVEYGYSITALSSYFERVVGVDTFEGDKHTNDRGVEGLYEAVQEVVPKNVKLVKSSYQDYFDPEVYDLIHIDIVHTYEDTFACGDWAMKHARVVLFHDTESFPEVRRAVEDLANKYNVNFYNYPFHHGLGILCPN